MFFLTVFVTLSGVTSALYSVSLNQFLKTFQARSFYVAESVRTYSIYISGVTILLSLTVFMNMVSEIMPNTSDAVPLIGNSSHPVIVTVTL